MLAAIFGLGGILTAWLVVVAIATALAIGFGGLEVTGAAVCPTGSDVDVDLHVQSQVGGGIGMSPEVLCLDGADRTDRTFAALAVLFLGVGVLPTLLALGFAVVAVRSWRRRR